MENINEDQYKKLDADAVLPTRGSSQAAGYDLYAKVLRIL